MTFGWYPSFWDAVRIFLRVSGATLAPWVKARDTAEMETPARSATWRAVTLASLLLPVFGGNADHLPLPLRNTSHHICGASSI